MHRTRSRQEAAIAAALAVFVEPGQAVELRALGVGGRRAVCACFTDMAGLAAQAAELDAQGAAGCYFTPNPLRPDLAGSRASCRKADVLRRRWLLVDVDPVRPAGVASTDAEREAAWSVLERCRGVLDAAGLAGAVVGDSGNGWHLCHPLDLPADDAAHALVKAALKGLGVRCGDDTAIVDPATHDAPRIWKLYGTRSRKGEPTAQRPHRWARLIEGEPWEAPAAQANNAALARLVETWRRADDMRRGRPHTDAHSYAAAALRQECAAVAAEPPEGRNRNNRLNRAAFALGQLVAAGAIDRGEVEAALLAAARACGLPDDEAAATIRSGLEAGLLEPRQLPEANGRPGARAAQPEANGHAGAAPDPAPAAEKADAYAIVLGWFRGHYQPVFRRGQDEFFSAALGEYVSFGQLVRAPTRGLVELLAVASDPETPRGQDGNIKPFARLKLFGVWSKVAAQDMLAALPRQEDAAEVSPDAAGRLARGVARALCTHVALGRTVMVDGQPVTSTERRTLLDWCSDPEFCLLGKWTCVRGYRLWARKEVDGVRVAIHPGLFGQVGPKELADMGPKELGDLVTLYDLGRHQRIRSARVVVLNPDFLAEYMADRHPSRVVDSDTVTPGDDGVSPSNTNGEEELGGQ